VRSQLQHYLPEVYLNGFATGTGVVWRYDRGNCVLKPLPPRVIAAERDLYSIITGDELSQEIETRWFSPLDGRFGPILRKILKGEELSTDDLMHLANFVAYLRVRTPATIRETELRWRQFDSHLGTDRDAIKYRSGPPDNGSPDTYIMTEQQCDNVSTSRADDAFRNEILSILVKTGIHLAGALLDLEWTLLFAPRRRSFIVGDNPFVIVPPESHDVDLEGVGPLTP
jgi:hypothetical protein